MSLLMDALRRAEAEKKNASLRRDDLSIDLPETSNELSLEPLEASTERPLRVLSGEDTAYDQQAAPTRQGAPRLARDALATEPEPSPFLTAPVGPGSAAQPTIVTAQTVFEATRGDGIPRALIAVIVCTVLLAAGLTAVGLYAYRQTPPPHPIPSPRVAAQVEIPPSPPPAPPTTPAAVATPVSPAPASPVAEARREQPTIEQAPASPPAPPTEAAAPSAAPIAPPVAASRPVAEEPPSPSPAPVTSPPAVLSPPPLARSLAADIPRDAEITGGEVRIAKRTTGGHEVDDVTRAYGAFQLGKLELARELYHRALRADPARVDALLGLGAIAMREQRLAEAHRLYREVLAKSPRHPVASAALFMIEGGQGNENTESRLKLLADQDAQSPYLRFALGNLYARQRRWTDAQEAYFAAFSRAPDNADYAYNLAVSLDQLGQRKAALEYYRKALSLRAPGAGAFDPERAHARIAALVGAP